MGNSLQKKEFPIVYLSIDHIVHTQDFSCYIMTYFVKQWYNKSGRCIITSFVMLSLIFTVHFLQSQHSFRRYLNFKDFFLRIQTSLSSCFAIL